ncbi:hypothetical protein AB4Z22_39725, partial [Paenibacillus sp. TAF58]
ITISIIMIDFSDGNSESYTKTYALNGIGAPEHELLASIRRADVIETTLERGDRVRKLSGAAGKTIITVGDPNDVSLLLNLTRT